MRSKLPDLTNYYLFAKVAQSGSISAAAKQLGMPKSTLSRRLTELEEEQGVRLMHRSTRGLKLTDIGHAFLLHCESLVSAAEAAQQTTQVVQEYPRGDIKLSSPYAISQTMLKRLLPEFLERYPDVRIQLVVTNTPVNLIDDGIDIALRVRPEIESSSLIARPLMDAPSRLYASPSLLAQFGIEHPLDLTACPHLSLHYSSGRYRYEFKHQETAETLSISYRARLITDDMMVLKEAAIAGQGVVALPPYIVDDAVNNGLLQTILPQWQLPMGIMHLVYPHRRGLLPAVRVLIDFLVERLPQLDPEV